VILNSRRSPIWSEFNGFDKITTHFFSVRTEDDFSALRVIREDELSPFSYALLFALIFCLPHRWPRHSPATRRTTPGPNSLRALRPKAHIFLTSQLLTFSLFCLQPQTYIREANVRVGLRLTIPYFKSLFVAQKDTPVPAGHHFIHGFQMVLTRKSDLPGTLTY
jgi:hypothetical protein